MESIFDTAKRQIERGAGVNQKQETLRLLDGRDLNGYNWRYYEKGAHVFSKPENGKFAVIKAKQEDLTNGNIEYFTKHGISR